MVLATVLCPNQEKSRFDHGYCMTKHSALVRQRWEPMGLTEARFRRGLGTPDGKAAPYWVIALLTFFLAGALQKAVAAHGAEIFSGIPNFTDVQPTVQVNEALE